ncbi:MAG: SDR family NAD(P)-dependent oxidoreductase [Alphaproteobacteria bacterium]|nr:SDR family NAD(P)-dependent oxidoreductase [Alphaproteobacteria bacterium]
MNDRPIAIVGASCRFPGAANLDAFWDLLVSGTDAVGKVDESRWATRFFYHPGQGTAAKSYTWSAGLINDVDRFEPAFFGLSPREAAQMDPQQRILLELVWHAIEDAGITSASLAGAGTGVYIGASSTDYRELRLSDMASGDSYFMTGAALSIIANRISYIYDLRGPSLTIDTACSSSLVALHHACEAIRDGRIGSAVVGGINLLLAPYPFLGFCRASMLSRRGHCYAFDSRADGYVRGEGGGIVILKPLDAAIAAGDRIRGVILGTGVNSDGRTIGLSLPSETAQAALLRGVYAEAGIAPDDLAFFEMHGTGTPAGDPIEATAVGESLGQGRADPLLIGSVKTNIGHLEPASGMAGLLKAAMALDHGIVPPSINWDAPNPNIPFEKLNIRVATQSQPIAAGNCAGVNSFGFGGTNAHAILGAPPAVASDPVAAGGDRALPPLVLSARSEASLRELAEGWYDKLEASAPADAPALLRGLARHRDQHPERLVALGKTRGETLAALGDYIAGVDTGDVITGSAVRDGKLAFAFAGNGAQWPGMGRNAYRANGSFQTAVKQVDAALRPTLGWSVAEMIESGVTAEQLVHADVAQPLLFATQVGIVTVLRELGIAAQGNIGHSVGEIAAAWNAGALSLAEAARVVVARSRQQERTRGNGRMGALALGEAAAKELLLEIGSPLEVGAINATQSVTVSGPSEALDRLAAEAHRRGVAFRALDLDFAFHSAAMDTIRDELIASLSGLTSAEPQGLLVSTVTGQPIASGWLGAEYWWRNIRSPVRFTEGMAALADDGFRVFVEIGPHAVLQSYLNDAVRVRAEGQGRVLSSLTRRQGEEDPFPAIAARCHVAGHSMVAASRFDGPAATRGLPLYPWQREQFWFEGTVEATHAADPAFVHPLLGFRQGGPVPYWLNHLDPGVLPWLADHAIEGVPVMPAAGMLEMALAAALQRKTDARAIEVADLELRRPLPFEEGRSREVRTVIEGDDGDWQLSSRTRLADEPPTVHAVARIVTAGDSLLVPGDAEEPTGPRVGAEQLYSLASQLGLDYGPQFRTVRDIVLVADDEAVATLDASVIAEPIDDYLLHPALLDGALQALLALITKHASSLEGSSFLPWRFGRVRLLAPYGRIAARARVRVTRLGSRSAAADITLIDQSGDVIAQLTDCWFRRVELSRRGSAEDQVLRVALVPAPLGSGASPPALEAILDWLAGVASDRQAQAADSAEQKLLFDALIASLSYQALSELIDPEAAFAVADLLDNGTIAADSTELCEYVLELLARFGAVTTEYGQSVLRPDNDLPDVGEVWRLILAETPDNVAELALVADVVNDLKRVLTQGPWQPEATPPAMIEHLLHGSPPSSAGIDLVASVLDRIAAGWPAGRVLRILEIGADGGATQRLLNRLMQAGTPFEYRATHPDAEQAARLSFAVNGIPGASAAHWSADADDDDATEQFDIVVAVHACARLQLDARQLARLHAALAPRGLFIALEPEPNPGWDITFGRYNGWWHPGQTGALASPLRSAEEWRGELAISGFEALGTCFAANGCWTSTLIWGRKPQQTPSAATVAAPAAPAERLSVELMSTSGTIPDLLSAALTQGAHHISLFAPEAGAPSTDRGAPSGKAIAVFIVDEPQKIVGDTAHALALLARAAAAATQRHMPLYVVTRGAQQVAAGGDSGVIGAAAWGFGRVLMNEMPRLNLRLLDLPPGDWGERASLLLREIDAQSSDSEIVWTAEGRHVLRLRRGLTPRWADAGDIIGLTSGQQGGIDALRWQSTEARPPRTGDVVIDVAAAGLNFRDMMWGMGLLPEEALIDGFAGATFGLECAGVVRAVGAGVDDLAVGDRVAGFAPAALSSRVTTAAHAVTRITPETSFAAAATIPVTFVTAVYALGTLGQVMPGEVVLIHAAAGGVGLAAIQYAKYRGATVIATAGSEIKRAFLRLAGADHVLDSRDIGFADAVRGLTGGVGVDLVLNSLSGEAMEQSLGVLKPFGRFLELGKRDFYLNRRIHLRPLRQNITYFAIDVDQLPVQRPDLARALLTEVSEALAAGAIRPLAHRVFSFAQVHDAFRLMQASGHIGKLVLVPEQNKGVRLAARTDLTIRRDSTYVVTGGITGFGFAAARWLAEQGAGSIALLSRRGMATSGAAEKLGELTALGADARVYACDVTEAEAVAATLRAVRAAQPPIRGVVHAASVIGDALATELDGSNIEGILAPKLAGALNLDRLTRDDPIELFVMFSSATTLLGAPGQGVYVAANLALEAIARHRKAVGLPVLTVGWGPIADTGYLADRPETRDALARRLGAKPMAAAKALAALPMLVASGLSDLALAETSWHEARRFLPILATPLFAEMHGDAAASQADDTLAERLASLSADDALIVLKTLVAEEASNILRLPASAIDPLRPLAEMGMDSLMAVELRLALENRLRVDLPLMSLAEGTSIASIAARLVGAVSGRPGAVEVLSLVERYEGRDLAMETDERFDRVDIKSAAAE